MTRSSLPTFLLMGIVVLLASHTALAGEWDDEFPVTQDPLPQYRLYPTASPDDILYVLWPDWTDWEDTQILLIRSEDKGATWTEPATIFSGEAYDNMALHADAAGLHLLLVEFYEDEEEFKYLYYAQSTDGGEFFTEPTRVGERENIEAIKLFSRPGMLYIYAQNYDPEEEVAYNYIYVSDDNGATWVEKPLLPGQTVQNPSFIVSEGVVHMAFGGFLVHPDIMHSTSMNDGDSWTPPIAVSSGAGTHSQLPDIVVDGGAIHVTWEDDRLDHFNVMYSRSTDGGLTWSGDEQLNDTVYGARAHLLADEEGLHVVWCQYHGDDGWPSSWSSADYGILWYKFSEDAGGSWSDEFRVSQNEEIPLIDLPNQGANYVEFAEYGNGFCAMWLDKRDGNVDLYMRNNQGTSADVPDETRGVESIAALALWANPLGEPLANISFRIGSERANRISCQLVDPQGRILGQMLAKDIAAGENQIVSWPLPPLGKGVYFARLSWGRSRSAVTHRLVVVR